MGGKIIPPNQEESVGQFIRTSITTQLFLCLAPVQLKNYNLIYLLYLLKFIKSMRNDSII